MLSNPQLELAFSFITETNRNVYLTGKAGTGKTTFLKKVKREVLKRMAVVAPTGVAAINAEGVTIHSLFQLPFGPYIPGQNQSDFNKRRFNKKKINLIKSLEVLVIDEISMVRSDTLDAIDAVLRRYRSTTKPFGGVQLLMIGDLHQLPPVVKSDEWNLLQQHYSTPYFFGSRALEQTDYVSIELEHIFRQDNSEFIALLNKVRDNQMDQEVIDKLNSRFIPDFTPSEDEGYITLSSHNRTADSINAEKLRDLEGKTHSFDAELEGDFPSHIFPTQERLELKENAQVMFVKNDPSEDKAFYNGKIGKVQRLTNDAIWVKCSGEDEEIQVTRLEWENRQFKLNEKTKEVEENVIGSFEQFPLKLAWSITIHKSQGLTFDRLVIDAADAFAHGQVYVALSRCTTFEGIVLRSMIGKSSVQTDRTIQEYSKRVQENEPNEDDLLAAKHAYQCGLIRDLFEFAEIRRKAEFLRQAITINEKSLIGDLSNSYQAIYDEVGKTVLSVAAKFVNELQTFFQETTLPEENSGLQERLNKAGSYFIDRLEAMQKRVSGLSVITDNSEVENSLQEKINDLEREIWIQLAGLRSSLKTFNSEAVKRAKADADIDFTKSISRSEKKSKSRKLLPIPEEIEHKELYAQLVEWRRSMSSEAGVPAYRVAATKTLIEIAVVLPTSIASLKKINGIGKVKAEQYGEDILDFVNDYCASNDLKEVDLLTYATRPPTKPKKKKKEKKDSKLITLELHRSGKSIDEIAEERSLVTGTIESHLAHYIKTGEVSVYDFIKTNKVRMIEEFFEKASSMEVSSAKARFGDDVSYGELRMVQAHVIHQKEE